MSRFAVRGFAYEPLSSIEAKHNPKRPEPRLASAPPHGRRAGKVHQASVGQCQSDRPGALGESGPDIVRIPIPRVVEALLDEGRTGTANRNLEMLVRNVFLRKRDRGGCCGPVLAKDQRCLPDVGCLQAGACQAR